MKIIIAGDGKIGNTLTSYLASEGYEITVIDIKKEALDASAEKNDVMTIHGNCAALRTLIDAGIRTADILIATTRLDEINLLTCMTARMENSNIHTIARIRNPEYYDQVYNMSKEFAISLMINPERHAALEISRLLELPGFLQRDSFAKDRVEIVELRINSTSKLNNVRLSDLSGIVNAKVLVCTVLRDGKAIMPSGDFVLEHNDRIFVTAGTSELSTLLSNLGKITKKTRKVLIAGGGKISYYLAKMLIASGVKVSIVDINPAVCDDLARKIPEADIILGDASTSQIADSEHYSSYDAIVALTGSDEMNIVISLFARDLNVPVVVTKVARQGSLNVMERLSIGGAICPQDLCANVILRYVRAVRNQSGAAVSVHGIASGMAEAAEFVVDNNTKNIGVPLKNIRMRKNVLISSVTNSGKIEIANGNTTFEPGDTIIVVSNKDTSILQLNDIFL